MANVTALPTYTNNKFIFWNAKLTDSLDNVSTAQSLYWDTVPVDENSATITGSMLIAARNTRRNPNRTEMMWIPAGKVNADGLGAVDVVRGLRPSGLDMTTGSNSFIHQFDSGDEIFCAILPQDGEMFRSAIQGGIATGAVGITFGTDAGGETITMYRTTGAGTKVGFMRWYLTSTKVEFSDDGVTWQSLSDAVASVLVKTSSADTTPGYLYDKIDVATAGRLTKSIGNPAGNETVRLTLATTLTDAEMNQLHGISANVTAANANTLVAGAASNADALHAHSNLTVTSLVYGEAIDGSTTPKAGFISHGTSASDAYPLQVQETENDAGTATYGVNFSAMTFTTGTFQTKITKFDLMFMKFAAGADTQIDIYAVDGSHKPTGASLGNATITAASMTTTEQGWYTATIALTVTPNTEYAIVAKAITGTAVNYTRWSVGNGNTYAGGQAWTSADAGVTWSSQANDFAFRVWGYEAQTAGRVYQSDKDEPFRGMFDGFCTSNTAAGVAGGFRMSGVQNSFTGLTAGSKYYVDSTLGGYTTSTGGLQIGVAVSTTEIEIDKNGGFVDVPLVTSANMGQDVTFVKTYQMLMGCGFKPSRIRLDIKLTVQTGAGTNERSKVFIGEYTSSLNGFTINMGNEASFIPSTTMLSAASGFSVTDGAAAASLTAGSFVSAENGLTFALSVSTALASTAVGTAQARCFR